MSIKPVDFQVALPKTAEVSRIQSEEQQKNSLFQQQQNMSVRNDAEKSLRQVHSQNKPENAKIREKRDKHEEKKRKNKNNNIIYSKNRELEEEIRISTIDIRL
jgi:hypothetical protein